MRGSKVIVLVVGLLGFIFLAVKLIKEIEKKITFYSTVDEEVIGIG